MDGEETDSDAEVEARALFVRAGRGERAALAALYDRYAVRLHGYARALLRLEVDADETLQEVFLGLARAKETLASVESPTAYLFRAVRHAALALAKRGRRAAAGLEHVSEPLLRARDANVAAEETEEANALLARLPEDQREVLLLKVYAGLTFKEIAELLAISPNTAASRYRYALDKLREARGGTS